ncbi:MAG: response regulator [Halobacteriovoraceae bacterium]|nr:response regulator [Halobacteriovoraceae bacterium]
MMKENEGALLLVDDEELILDIVANLLEDKVNKIYKAKNGEEGLELIKKHSDIVCTVCDIRMPIMDGIEMIKHVRKLGNEMPFIFYTGHGNEDLMLEVVKYGAFDFINKPGLEDLEEIFLSGMVMGEKIYNLPDDQKENSALEFNRLLEKLGKN